MMPKSVLIVALATLLSACQQTPVRDDSPRSRLETGTVVVLNKSLRVPSGHARVFLQKGKVREKMRLRRYEPHCNFEIRSVSDGSALIEPDRFLIAAVYEDEEEVVRRRGAMQYAALYLADDGFVPQVNRFVRYTLSSEQQPDVRYLTCHGGFNDPWMAKYPSIVQVREALREWVSFDSAKAE